LHRVVTAGRPGRLRPDRCRDDIADVVRGDRHRMGRDSVPGRGPKGRRQYFRQHVGTCRRHSRKRHSAWRWPSGRSWVSRSGHSCRGRLWRIMFPRLTVRIQWRCWNRKPSPVCGKMPIQIRAA